ncbi:hypothetical protein GYMLUDRAFT_254763 [Collybiopsis luxurians FD-317 M1]|nr:hypothetical protein GYMLUDRAFT_254763 [Collybiopsis luxurians FD-317 M1]
MFNARHPKGYSSETALKEHLERAREKQSSMQDQETAAVPYTFLYRVNCAKFAGRVRQPYTASPLEKYPLQQAVATDAGKLICPNKPATIDHLRGSTEVHFRRGDNLFLLTWRHYSQAVSSDEQQGSNYVGTDGIAIRLHEYLGPSPAVSGFVAEDGKATILFYDQQLKKTWSALGPWKITPSYKDGSWICCQSFGGCSRQVYI